MLRHRGEIFGWFFFLVSLVPHFLAEVPHSSSAKGKLKGDVVELDESNWDQVLHGEWMVEFHAPWCPACRDFQPEFKRFAEWDKDLNLKAGAVDVHAHPSLSGRFLISALPTIYHVRDGEFRQYTGVRDRERMMRFIEEQDWKKLTPVSPWLNPTTPQMGIVGGFFKLSMQLKNLHTWMVEDKGIPNWLTYVLFGVGTITLGGIIGVLLVLVIEVVTRKRSTGASAEKSSGKESKIQPRKPESRSGSESRSASVSGSGSASEGTGQEKTGSGTGSGSEVVSSGSDAEASGTDEDKSQKEAEPEVDTQVRRRKARRED